MFQGGNDRYRQMLLLPSLIQIKWTPHPLCHPGAAVAHTRSFSCIHNQCFGAICKWAYPHPCECVTAFGLPVVPDV